MLALEKALVKVWKVVQTLKPKEMSTLDIYFLYLVYYLMQAGLVVALVGIVVYAVVHIVTHGI